MSLQHKEKLPFSINQRIIFSVSILFLALLPFNIGKILTDDLSYAHGRYINYFQTRITLLFLVGLILVGSVFLNNLIQKKNRKSIVALFCLIISLVIWNLYLSSSVPAFIITSTIQLMQFVVVSMGTIIALAVVSKDIAKGESGDFSRFGKYILAGVTGLQVLLQSLQILNTGPIFPSLLKFLGQPIYFDSFSQFGEWTLHRGYGTAAHPNILGGVFLVYVAVFLTQKNRTLIDWITITLLSLGILLTFSRATIAVLIIFIVIYMTKYLPRISDLSHISLKNTVTVVLGFTTGVCLLLSDFFSQLPLIPYFLSSRIALLKSASALFLLFPTGTGFGLLIERSIHNALTPIISGRLLLEPVHNSILLPIVELGLLGSLLLLFLYYFLLRKTSLTKSDIWIYLVVIVTVIGAFDHFLIY